MAWGIAAAWNTGDINTRATSTCAVINDAGTPKIIAPVIHGVKCFDRDGNLVWTYNSITNGYDVRHIAVGNLNATGYNDCSVVCSGYYTTGTDGKVAILDKDGNLLDMLLTSDFGGTAPSNTVFAAVDGTDIYISTNLALHKFVKSGAAWSESWYVALGACKQISVADLGNGKRIIVDVSSVGIKCIDPADGSVDWTQGGTNQYQGVFAIGKLDSTKTGDQIVLPYQSGGMIIDKDGNNVGSFTPSNVGGGVCAYDCDGDGEDEFYFSDMARDVYCYERTGVNTYAVKYTLADVLTASTYAGLAHFDINDDGDDEIFIFTTDGHCFIYDKTLATQLADLNIGHGIAGGFSLSTYQNLQNGIKFADTSGDGHEDLIISGNTGYVDVFECSGFGSTSPSASPSLSPSISPSLSPSISPSQSPSASPSAGYQGYTRGDYAALPTDDADLETAYSVGDVTNVATKDDVRVDQSGTSQYMIHEFKDYTGENTRCTLEWEGMTTLAPSASTVYLQIYNRNTTSWETVDSDNTSLADVDFILTATIADLTNYKDGNTLIACRVYQLSL